jgi:NADPH-dependent curcumin reductase CurA
MGTMSPTLSRQVHLVSRPTGWPSPENFSLVEVEVPELAPGEVLVRNTVMSVDPYMRGRMNDTRSYVPPFQLDAPLDGGAVGEVVASDADEIEVGQTVMHGLGWRDLAVVDASRVRPVDTTRAPASAYLGVLGMPGLTAYVGLTRIAQVSEGDTVFVSGAAGAVGSAAGQIARKLGAGRVVGSAGSPEKVAYLRDELGYDAAFDYHDGPVRHRLAEHAPDGIDVYFDNVGGEHLEAAIGHMRDFGRVAACGAISQYNDEAPTPGPRNLTLLVTRRLTLRGFIVADHQDVAPEYAAAAAGWVADGSLRYRETVVDGLENAVDAFLGLHRGENVGKMLVRLDAS